MKPRQWFVPGLIPSRVVTLLSGDGGTGKSQLALQLVAASALRTDWLGLPAMPGPCLFYTAEDEADELHKRQSLPLAIKYSAGADAGTFSAYGSTFGPPADSYNDIIAPGAFTKTIADHRAAGTSPALLWSHDMQQPIGVITQLS